MPLDEIEELAREKLDAAWRMRQTGQVPPAWFLVPADDDEPGRVILTPWKDDREKALTDALIALEADKLQCRAVVFVSDSWMKVTEKPEGITMENWRRDWRSAYDGVPPSESPDAIECLLAYVWRRGAAMFTLTMTYRERDDGSFEILEDVARLDESQMLTFGAVNRAMA